MIRTAQSVRDDSSKRTVVGWPHGIDLLHCPWISYLPLDYFMRREKTPIVYATTCIQAYLLTNTGILDIGNNRNKSLELWKQEPDEKKSGNSKFFLDTFCTVQGDFLIIQIWSGHSPVYSLLVTSHSIAWILKRGKMGFPPKESTKVPKDQTLDHRTNPHK